jgi:hypothetical protein
LVRLNEDDTIDWGEVWPNTLSYPRYDSVTEALIQKPLYLNILK